MKSFGYIYKTTNLVSGRIYVGQKTGTFAPDYYGSGILLKRSLNKYGSNNFKLELIVYAKSKSKLNKLEKEFIKKYRQIYGKRNLYNISDGGEGGKTWLGRKDTFGRKNNFYHKHHSKDTKLYLRKLRKGKTCEEIFGETKAKIIRKKLKKAAKYRIYTKERNLKISKSKIGIKRPDITGKNHKFYGKSRPDISKIMKARWANPKIRTKLINQMKLYYKNKEVK
jgi:hypothetical protein